MTADWLSGSAGKLFCLQFAPPAVSSPCRGLLIVPPFGEEMNRCRRMMALAARAAAARGRTTLILDLFGTGDSEGDFADATCSQWRQDLAAAASRLLEQGASCIDVLALRAGALLLDLQLWSMCGPNGRLVLWQPVVNGRQYVNQLLRVKLAEGVVSAGGGESMPRLRERLAEQGNVEIAGYATSAALVAGLEQADFVERARDAWLAISWHEVAVAGIADLPPGSARTVAALRDAGKDVDTSVIPGEPFWGTPEVATVPALIDAMLEFLGDPDG